MVHTPSNRALCGRWRRGLFWAWVAGSAVVAAYIGIAGPFAGYFAAAVPEATPAVALALPALMIFMLATGLGWLVLMVASRPRRRRHEFMRPYTHRM